MSHVYWFTGLSGSGKTTIGKLFYKELTDMNCSVAFLDGDEMRWVFGNDLGYTLEERKKSAMRNARLCKLLSDQGLDIVCCTISMFDSVRDWNKKHIPGYVSLSTKSTGSLARASTCSKGCSPLRRTRFARTLAG